MSTEENNSINEKKNKENINNNWEKFGKDIATNIANIIILVYIFGTLLLYTTKVYQSGIISNNFLNSTQSAQKNSELNYIRKFIISTQSPFIEIGDKFSQKVNFIEEKSFIKVIIDEYLKDDKNILKKFYGKVFDSFLSLINSINNLIFKSLGGLNESLLMFFSSIICFVIFIFYFILNFWASLFFHVRHLFEILYDVLFNQNGTKKTIWSNSSKILNFFLFFFYLWLLFFVIFPLCFFSSFVLFIFSLFYCAFPALFYKFKYKNGDMQEENGIAKLFLDFFKYKTSFIMILLSLGIINSASKNLESIYVAGSIISIIILSFLGIYNTDTNELDSTFTPTK